MIDLVGRRHWFFVVSGLLLVPGLIAILLGGLRPGVDFTGGTLWELRFRTGAPAPIQASGADTLFVRTRQIEAGSAEKAALTGAIQARFGAFDERFESVGPAIGAEMAQRAVLAVGLASLGICGYLWFAFRSVPNALRYGVTAIVALLHDALIMLGIFAILGLLFDWEIDGLFVTALLVGIVIGTFSSIFFASMLLVAWADLSAARRARTAAQTAARYAAAFVAALLVTGTLPPAAARAADSPAAEAVCRPIVRVDRAIGDAAGGRRLEGWAIDALAPAQAGTGVLAVQLGSVEPDAGSDLGAAEYGSAREDVAAVLGEQHLASGFTLHQAGSLPAGTTVPVQVLTACGWESLEVPVPPVEPATSAASPTTGQPVAPCQPLLAVDFPQPGANIALGGELTVAGWAVNPAYSGAGSGIEEVVVRSGTDPAGGEVLGAAQPAMPRGEVATSLGLADAANRTIGYAVHIPTARLKPTGPDGNPAATGTATFTVIAHTACGTVSRTVSVELAVRTGQIGSENDVLAPTNLRLVGLADGVARLAWDPSPSPRLSAYVVRMSIDGKEFRTVDTVAPAVLRIEVTGLAGTGRYEFQVLARRHEQVSGASNTVSNAPPTNPAQPLPGRSATPAAPAHFFDLPGNRSSAAVTPVAAPGWVAPTATPTPTPTAATPATGTALPAPTITAAEQVFGGGPGLRSVRVAFTSVPGAVGYTLYRAAAGSGSWVAVAQGGAGDASLLDAAIVAPGTYTYAVVAWAMQGGASGASNAVAVSVR